MTNSLQNNEFDAAVPGSATSVDGKRLALLIAQSGLCSRRAASRLITAGRVSVNGQLVSHTLHLPDTSTICVDGKPLPTPAKLSYYLYHKPVGIDCNIRPEDPASIAAVLRDLPARLYPVGRLDKDSRGLLLLTNDGALTQRLLHPGAKQAKTYWVEVDKPLAADLSARFAAGISWQVGPHRYQAQPCQARPLGTSQFEVILYEGQNRQIRYMCRELGYRVQDLCRVAIDTIQLGELPSGAIRSLSQTELIALTSLILK